MTIADSSAGYNGWGFFADGGAVTLYGDRVVFNAVGLAADANGALYFANCVVSGNRTSYQLTSGSMIAGSSPGTALITPGQGSNGTLSGG